MKIQLLFLTTDTGSNRLQNTSDTHDILVLG